MKPRTRTPWDQLVLVHEYIETLIPGLALLYAWLFYLSLTLVSMSIVSDPWKWYLHFLNKVFRFENIFSYLHAVVNKTLPMQDKKSNEQYILFQIWSSTKKIKKYTIWRCFPRNPLWKIKTLLNNKQEQILQESLRMSTQGVMMNVLFFCSAKGSWFFSYLSNVI